VTPPRVVILPSEPWRWINGRELWRYRELIGFLTWRDVKVRYKQTLLGAAWAVLQPALTMVIFTIFFGRMAGLPSGGIPYPLFAYAGLLPWTFFATAVSNAGNSIIGSERLVTKVYFPRLAIPLAAVGAAVVDSAIAFGLLLGMMLYYGVAPGVGVLLVPVVFTLIAVAASGVGTLLAALNVSYRDFRHVIPFLVQFWLFATPTVYMEPTGDRLGRLQAVLLVNPLNSLVAAFRAACLGGPVPWVALGAASAVVATTLGAGCLYFRKVEDDFADLI
jgi:lipopolysaccharide transport system permease protein